MKRFIFFGLIAMLLLSCKTTKTTLNEQSTTKIEQATTSEQTTKTEATTEAAAKVTDQSTADTNEVGETTTVLYAAPDSTGTQHIVSVTTTKYKKGSSVKSNVVAENGTKTNIEQTTKQSDQSNIKATNEVQKATTTKTEKNTPAWVIWAVVICCIGLVVLVYLILKRFKIVK
jgi:cobalamin biosynthesis Mg chelatase CobN